MLKRRRRGPRGCTRPGCGYALLLIAALLTLPSTPRVSHGGGLDGIQICHGFGCRYQETVSITEKEWTQIRAFFRAPAETAEAERKQIRKAAGWFEVIAGRHTPIHLDLGGNKLPGGFEDTSARQSGQRGPRMTGQMDCIDESRNMTTYLSIMEEAGLFRHHRVVERARRRSAFDQHYAGQIEEIESGARWVVDSWFYDYGSLPYLEEAEEWHDIPFLFSTAFPEAPDG